MSPGVHLLHKPVGPTSFSVVQGCLRSQVAKPANARLKMCHGGTLDPFASGLLLLLVEPATQLFDHLHAVPKVYEAKVRWGIETENGDPLGRVVATGDAGHLTPDVLDEAIASFAGWQDQVPPATSAKRIDGERAYVKAHRGEAVILPPSRVYLHEAQWIEHDLPNTSRLRLTVRGGFYVRSLVRDIGRRLGCGAHLEQLCRAAIGPWEDPSSGVATAISGGAVLPWAPSRELTDREVGDLREGRTIPLGEWAAPEWSPPTGFPDPQAPVRGMHLARFAYLLRPEGGRLISIAALRGRI